MKQILLTLDEIQIATLQQDFKRKQAGYKARAKVLIQGCPNDDELININNRIIVYNYLYKQMQRATNSHSTIS